MTFTDYRNLKSTNLDPRGLEGHPGAKHRLVTGISSDGSTTGLAIEVNEIGVATCSDPRFTPVVEDGWIIGMES